MPNKLTTLTKTLLAPTLIIAGLAACGYQDGTRTNTYNGTNTYGYQNGTNMNDYNNYGSSGTTNAYGHNTFGTTGTGSNTFGYNNYGNMGPNGFGYNTFGTTGFNGLGYNNYVNTGPHGFGFNNNGGPSPNGNGYNAHDYSGIYRLHSTMVSRIENEAKKVAGVSQANADIKGNDITISIKGRKGSDLKQLEKKVHQAVKNIEPTYRIHVTTDHKMNGR